MRVEVIVEDVAWTAALPEADAVVARAAAQVQGEEEAAVLLADDAAVQALNRQFRAQDKPTNVLSFPAPDASPPPDAGQAGHLGDIVLAYGVCAAEAAAQGKRLADHLAHLTIHGLLHLRGYDHIDEDEAEAMEELERELLARLGVSDPYDHARASHTDRP